MGEDTRVKDELIRNIIKLDEELWIPMHRTTVDELEVKSLMELTMYMNSLIHVRDNPV